MLKPHDFLYREHVYKSLLSLILFFLLHYQVYYLIPLYPLTHWILHFYYFSWLPFSISFFKQNFSSMQYMGFLYSCICFYVSLSNLPIILLNSFSGISPISLSSHSNIEDLLYSFWGFILSTLFTFLVFWMGELTDEFIWCN